VTSAVSAPRRAALLALTLVLAALVLPAGGQAARADAPAPQKLRWVGVKPDGTANSYTGSTIPREGGTLTIGNDAALGTGKLLVLGGTLQPSGGVREVPNAIDFGLFAGDDPLEVTLAGDHQLRLTGPIRLTTGAPRLRLRVTNSKKVTVEGTVTEETPDSSIHKVGPGTLEVTGITSHSGSTWVQEGELRLDTAIIRGRVLVGDFEWLSEPKLTGFGTIGGDLSAVEGMLDPGLDDDTAGTFVVGGDLRMFHGRYAVDLHGPGSNDSITVDGPVVDLLDSDLGVRMHYNPRVGDSFTIIDHRGKGATTGPFGERWAEGARFVIRGPTGLFVTMTITYRGGDGNDVVLTALSREQLSAGPPPVGDPVPA
jgi:autotransporter-associated beta strand protein